MALVVAEDFDTARHAASLVKLTYEAEAPTTDVGALEGAAYVPPKKRSGIKPPPEPWGDAQGATRPPRSSSATAITWRPSTITDGAPRLDGGLGGRRQADCLRQIPGRLEQLGYITGVFGMKKDDVHVLSPYLGGGFGSGLRPQYQLFLAVMAARELERSVRVTLTRDQMFTFGYRPDVHQTVALGAGRTVTCRPCATTRSPAPRTSRITRRLS